MKNVFSKVNLAASALLLVVLAGFSSCKKDYDNKNNLSSLGESIAGKWELSSFTIDGVEIMGAVISASKMEFEAWNGSNSGFEWSLIYSDGSGETQTGNYEEDYEAKEVEIKSRDGAVLKLDIDFNGDGLNLSGHLDDERILIKADRN